MAFRSFSLSVFLFVVSVAVFAEEEPYPWKGAVLKADITPSEMLWMAGYSARKGPAEGVLQPIFVKVLMLEDEEGTRLAFVTMDLIGVPREYRDSIEAFASEKCNVSPGALVINASHTHSGPMIRVYRPPSGDGGLAPSYSNIPEEQHRERVRQTVDYRNFVVSKVCELLMETMRALEPVDVSWSHSRCGFAMNRRTPMGPGEWKNFPNPDAPVDHEVPVLQVRAIEGDELKAVLFGYACHATVLSEMLFHGDWPGYAQHYLEEEHPGTVAMFLNGCSGDQNPYPRRLRPYVERHGRSMATAVEAALETEAIPIAGPIQGAIAWPEIPYQEAPTKEELKEKANSKDKYDARHAQFLLDVLERDGKFPESYPVPVQAVNLGNDLLFATIGGEVVIDYSLRLKKEFGEMTKGAPVWVAGYSNDVMTYIPSKRVLLEGGYEGGGAMRYVRSTVHPAHWDESIEERLVGRLTELVGEVWEGE